MNLQKFLHNNSITIPEGNCNQIVQQTADLMQLCENCKNILVIGFNTGYTTETFLLCSLAVVYSISINNQIYVEASKQYLDRKFPGRHKLIFGDSKVILPALNALDSSLKFDLIFIDSESAYESVCSDIINSKMFAHENSIVLLNNVLIGPNTLSQNNEGPSKVWSEIQQNPSFEILNCKDYGLDSNNLFKSMGIFKYKF